MAVKERARIAKEYMEKLDREKAVRESTLLGRSIKKLAEDETGIWDKEMLSKIETHRSPHHSFSNYADTEVKYAHPLHISFIYCSRQRIIRCILVAMRFLN